MSFPARHGKSYFEDEIVLVYRVARSVENAVALASRLERKPSAIDWIWRWMDGTVENFPPEAWNRLIRQIVAVRDRLGEARRGELSGVPPPIGRRGRVKRSGYGTDRAATSAPSSWSTG